MGRMISFLVKELALVAILAFPFIEIEARSRRVFVSAFSTSRWIMLPPSLLESDLLNSSLHVLHLMFMSLPSFSKVAIAVLFNFFAVDLTSLVAVGIRSEERGVQAAVWIDSRCSLLFYFPCYCHQISLVVERSAVYWQ